MAIYNPVTITPYRAGDGCIKAACFAAPSFFFPLRIHYLELLVKQQLHHQRTDAEHLGRHAEQGEQVVENHDLEVGQDGEASMPRPAARHLRGERDTQRSFSLLRYV